MICGNCGKESSIEGQRFCPACGTPFPQGDMPFQASPTSPFCGQCGAKTTVEGQTFCRECGARLVAALNVQKGTLPNPGSMPGSGQRPGEPTWQAAPHAQQNGPRPSYQPGSRPQYVYVQPPARPFTPKGYVKTSQDYTLRLVAAIINLVFCVLYGLGGVSLAASGDGFGVAFILCLAWMVPMTVYSWRISTGEKPNGTTFAVADLIFVNVVSGILLLISDKEA